MRTFIAGFVAIALSGAVPGGPAHAEHFRFSGGGYPFHHYYTYGPAYRGAYGYQGYPPNPYSYTPSSPRYQPFYYSHYGYGEPRFGSYVQFHR
jgi:hypothetical protein